MDVTLRKMSSIFFACDEFLFFLFIHILVKGEKMKNAINMHIEGKGRGMILLHGWGQNMKMMQPVADYFKSKYQVLNLDLPGFGKSSIPHSYCVHDYVLLLRELVKKYELECPIIIAHSFGARIAFQYASLFPVHYLIIASGAGIPPKHHFSYYFKVYSYKILRFFKIENQMGSKDYRNASDVMKRTLVNVVNEDASFCIKQIQAPMLLVWGDHDLDTPLWMAKRIKELNDNAALVIFKGEDHFAYYHQMHRFIQVCEHALKGCES